MKRQMELFLIILLPILGLVFLGGKIMNLTKRPEQKITASSSKKVVQKSKEEIKKRNKKRNETGKRAEKRNCHKNTDREQGSKTGGKRSAAEAGTEKTGCPYRRTGTADETGCRKISDRRIWCNGTSGGDYHEL